MNSATDELVERIVRDVLDSLRMPMVAARPVADASKPGSPTSAPTGSTSDGPPNASSSDQPTILMLGERIITGAVLEERITTQRQIAVDPKAVLTPSAWEYLKRHHIELLRAATSSTARHTAQSAGRSLSEESTIPRWRIFVVQTHPHLERLIEETNRNTTAIWERVVPGTLMEAVSVSIAAIARAEIGGGVILTHQPLVAACHANRQPGVRAAAVRDAADIRQAKQHLAANLYALDPTSKSYFELRNLLKVMTST